MTPEELLKLQKFMQTTFANPAIEVKPRPRKNDSAEVYIGEEFIGVMYLDEDDEDDERSFNFQMAILGFDLEDTDKE